jgi:hypothetical protein
MDNGRHRAAGQCSHSKDESYLRAVLETQKSSREVFEASMKTKNKKKQNEWVANYDHAAALARQQPVTLDWPLNKPGDEKFFGYVVAVGVVPGEYGYAEFEYNGDVTRYRMPDDGLCDLLLGHLRNNILCHRADDGMYDKVWIRRTEKGYEVELP